MCNGCRIMCVERYERDMQNNFPDHPVGKHQIERGRNQNNFALTSSQSMKSFELTLRCALEK